MLGGLLVVAQTLLNPFRFALMHSCARRYADWSHDRLESRSMAVEQSAVQVGLLDDEEVGVDYVCMIM